MTIISVVTGTYYLSELQNAPDRWKRLNRNDQSTFVIIVLCWQHSCHGYREQKNPPRVVVWSPVHTKYLWDKSSGRRSMIKISCECVHKITYAEEFGQKCQALVWLALTILPITHPSSPVAQYHPMALLVHRTLLKMRRLPLYMLKALKKVNCHASILLNRQNL